MTEMSMHELEERERYVELARQSMGFQDAVFYIQFYNTYRHFRDSAPAITPEDVFAEFDPDRYDNIACNAGELMGIAYVGAAFFHHPDSTESYEEAVQRMQDEYPGYSDKVYAKAAAQSVQAMR